MREIKFRAWDRVHGKMIEWEQYKGELVAQDFVDDLLVMMQYTGLKDKNGKEIYEGDICKVDCDNKPGIYVVIWDDYRCAWWLKNVKTDKRELQREDDFYQLLNNHWEIDYREIIGNIHENTELLEGLGGYKQ